MTETTAPPRLVYLVLRRSGDYESPEYPVAVFEDHAAAEAWAEEAQSRLRTVAAAFFPQRRAALQRRDPIEVLDAAEDAAAADLPDPGASLVSDGDATYSVEAVPLGPPRGSAPDASRAAARAAAAEAVEAILGNFRGAEGGVYALRAASLEVADWHLARPVPHRPPEGARPLAEVAREAGGWLVDNEGYLWGLTRGDQGYEASDTRLADLVAAAERAEAPRRTSRVSTALDRLVYVLVETVAPAVRSPAPPDPAPQPWSAAEDRDRLVTALIRECHHAVRQAGGRGRYETSFGLLLRDHLGPPSRSALLHPSIYALAAAVWELLVDTDYPEYVGAGGRRAGAELARASARIAYEPFRRLVDPYDAAAPPLTLDAAQRCLDAAVRTESSPRSSS